MNYLFLHPAFPGQIDETVRALGKNSNNNIYFITYPSWKFIEGVKKKIIIDYKEKRARDKTLKQTGKKAYLRKAIIEICHSLKKEGFVPDLIWIYQHYFFSAEFLREVFPLTPIINYFEFIQYRECTDFTREYYKYFGLYKLLGSEGKTYPFKGKPEKALFKLPAQIQDTKIEQKSLELSSSALEITDWVISPTQFQFDLIPSQYKDKATLLYDGVDTKKIKPSRNKNLQLPLPYTSKLSKFPWQSKEKKRPKEKILKRGTEIITFIASTLEPIRGYPTFMHALELVLKNRPDCHAVIIGDEGKNRKSYCHNLKKGTYKELYENKLELDKERVHYTGFVTLPKMLEILNESNVHVYLTLPFVLSWSLVKAMSMACLIIGSDTRPYYEFIKDGYNGFLVDIYSVEELADKIEFALENQDKLEYMRKNARKTVVDKYSIDKTNPLNISLLNELALGNIPPIKSINKIRSHYKNNKVF